MDLTDHRSSSAPVPARSSSLTRPHYPVFLSQPRRPTAVALSRMAPSCATRSSHSQRRSRRSSRPHFTNLDRPVFALTNLPETVKGALFARYSRWGGTLRRLYLDEFAAEVPDAGRPVRRRRGRARRRASTSGSSSASATTRSPRSAARTSAASGSRTSSPRCSSAAAWPPTWSSRPATSPTTSRSSPAAATATTRIPTSAPSTRRRWTRSSATTPRGLEQVLAWAEERWPRGDEPERAWRSSIRAKALDLMRGLLPASTLSHVGIFASGQAYEQLLLRLVRLARCPRRAPSAR